MERLRVLIANEPRSYREAITHALRELRPCVEISAIEPDGFEAEVARLHPHLVVCSRIIPAALASILSWVELYPDGENRAEVITAGEHAVVADVRFGDLLAVVDETMLLVSGVATDGHRRDETESARQRTVSGGGVMSPPSKKSFINGQTA